MRLACDLVSPTGLVDGVGLAIKSIRPCSLLVGSNSISRCLITPALSFHIRVSLRFSFPCSHHRTRWINVMTYKIYVTTPYRLAADDDGFAETEDWTDACNDEAALQDNRLLWVHVMEELQAISQCLIPPPVRRPTSLLDKRGRPPLQLHFYHYIISC